MPTGDTTALLKSIRGHTQLPTAQITFDDATTLDVATEELHSYILPTLLQERQEFWIGASGRLVYPLAEGVARYAIPPRAAGAKIRSARLLDITGTPMTLATYELEDVNRWVTDAGQPSGVVLEGSTIRLYPTPRGLAGWTLELVYYLRPGRLVPLASTGIVQSSATGSGNTFLTVVRTADNDDIFTSPKLDIVSATSPFDTVWMEAEVFQTQNISGSLWEIEFFGAMSIPVGSYICVPETAPVVQAPLEWHPLLALKVAARQLASVGDTDLAQVKTAEMREKEAKSGIVIRPRREDAGRKVRNGSAKWRNGWASSW